MCVATLAVHYQVVTLLWQMSDVCRHPCSTLSSCDTVVANERCVSHPCSTLSSICGLCCIYFLNLLSFSLYFDFVLLGPRTSKQWLVYR
jgi:hypothetical protein